jgi:hypothetical protein
MSPRGYGQMASRSLRRNSGSPNHASILRSPGGAPPRKYGLTGRSKLATLSQCSFFRFLGSWGFVRGPYSAGTVHSRR